jgi:hypothetical protein
METTLQKTVRTAPAKVPKLEDQLRGAIRERHYSLRTEEAYVMWYRQFVRFHHTQTNLEEAFAEAADELRNGA